MKNVRPVRFGTGLTRCEQRVAPPGEERGHSERCYVASAPLQTPISPAPSTRLRLTSMVRGRSAAMFMVRRLCTLVMSRKSLEGLSRAIDAPGELRVVSLIARDREVHVASILAAFVVLADRKHGLLWPRVLPNEPAHVSQPVRRAPPPESALAG